MSADIASYQNKIDRLRARSADSYILACQAAVPLILTPDLLYQLWNNFKQYQYVFEPGAYHKISHIAVSDLILSSFCREVGFELYEFEKGVRDILLDDLPLLLGKKRKNTIASFLNDYALLEHSYTHRKGLKDIHLLTAQSVLNPAEMERQIVERINNAETDAQKIDFLLLHHNLMPLGFESDLSAISQHIVGDGLRPILIAEENPNAPGVLNVILPVELRKKIRNADKPVIELSTEPAPLPGDPKPIAGEESQLRRTLETDEQHFGSKNGLKKGSLQKTTIFLLYDFFTDFNNELLRKLKKALEDNHVDLILSVPDEGLSTEELKLQQCDGVILFYGDSDPQWFLYRQSILMSTTAKVKKAVCLASTNIEKKLKRDVVKGIDILTELNLQSEVQKFIDGITLSQPASETGYEYDIYVSYNGRAAADIIGKFLPLLRSELETRYARNVKIFLDRKVLAPELSWPDVLTHAVLHSKIVLVLLTPEYFSNSFNLVEWSTFSERSQLTRSKLMLPIILKNGDYLDNYVEKEMLRIDLSNFNFQSKNFQEKMLPKKFLEQVSFVAQQISDLLQNVPPFDPRWTIADDKLINPFIENQQPNPSPFSENEYVTKSDTSTIRSLKVFIVSSPDELTIDRDALQKFITRENKRLSSNGIYINLIIQEHNSKSVNDNLQNEVNKFVKECDILVGLFSSKIGTYMLEEYDIAFEEYKLKGSPLLFTYFKRPGTSTQTSAAKNEKTVHDFQNKLDEIGHFYANYDTPDELILKFSSQLEKVVQSDSLKTGMSDKVVELALEYESTRKAMSLSDQRTLAMELIKDKMSLIAPDIITILPILISSKLPGERLAAIACLQEFPNPEYFNWLAIHVGDAEKHFIGYHASVALEKAVRKLGLSHYNYLLNCLDVAIKNVEAAKRKDNNQLIVLNNAKMMLLKMA